MKIISFYCKKKKERELQNEQLEQIAQHISKHKELKKKAVFVLGTVLMAQAKVYAGTGEQIAKLDQAGNQIVGVVRRVAYWVCFGMFIVEITKSLTQGDVKGTGRVGTKYALAFGSLYVFPFVLDLIRTVFSK